MATRTESVNFDIRANDKATPKINGLSSALQRTMQVAKLATVAIASTATAATAALARMTQQGLRTADDSAKMARRLNMTNAELRALELQAQLTGTPIERLTRGINQMSQQLDSISLSGAGRTAVTQLGIDIAALQRMRPADQFRVIADGFARIESVGARSALATALFRDRAGEMLEILASGGAGIDEAANLVDKLGLSLNAVDSRNIERANDSITVLKMQMQAFREGIAAGLAPAIEKVIDSINYMTIDLGGATQTGINFISYMVRGLPIVERLWTGLNAAILAGQTGILAVSLALFRMMQGLAMVEERIAALFGATSDGLAESLGSIAGDIERALVDTANRTNQQIQATMGGNMDQWKNWFDDVVTHAGSVGGAMQEVIRDTATVTTAQFNDVTRTVQGAANTIERSLTDAFMTGKLNAREMIRAIIADIIALTIRVAVIRPLFGAIGGAIGGPIGAAFATVATPGRSTGGDVAAGETKIVGENGPERVYFGANAFVQRSQKEQKQGITVIADMRGASAEAVGRLERMVAELSGSLERRAISAVADSYRRQPGYLMR